MEKQTAEQIISIMDNKIMGIGLQVESLTHVQKTLAHMAQDACSKQEKNMQMYFLWDNNDLLQVMDSLMFRLMNEINQEYKEVSELQSKLFKIMKVGEVTQ